VIKICAADFSVWEYWTGCGFGWLDIDRILGYHTVGDLQAEVFLSEL
jgi:hypothetical protein